MSSAIPEAMSLVAEDPRTITFNASAISISTVFVGLIIIVGVIALIAFILADDSFGTFRRRDQQQQFYQHSDHRRTLTATPWLQILAELEAAFAAYGLAAEDAPCQRRAVCRAYSGADAGPSADRLVAAVEKIKPELAEGLSARDQQMSSEILDAANKGYYGGSCDVAGCHL